MNILFNLAKSNALLSTSVADVVQNATRTFAASVSSSKLAEIEKKLGMPVKPKRPTTAYFQFATDLRPTLKSDGRKVTEITQELAKLWHDADPAKKIQYKQRYEKQLEVYKQKMEEYKKKVTPEQTELLKQEIVSMKADKERSEVSKQRRMVEKELGKPTKPSTGFLLFSKDVREKSQQKMTVAEIANEWNALSQSSKQVYADKAAKLQEQYDDVLSKWEQKMIKQGHSDLVRSRHLPKAPRTKRAAKAKSPE